MNETVKPQEDTKPKAEIIASFKAARASLYESVAIMRKSDMLKKTLGTWSVKDVLAHIIEWDNRSVDDAVRLIGGQVIEMSHLRDNSAFNKVTLRQFRSWTVDDIKIGLRLSTVSVINFLETIPDKELDVGNQLLNGDRITPRWIMDYPYHDLDHAAQIRVWRERNGL